MSLVSLFVALVLIALAVWAIPNCSARLACRPTSPRSSTSASSC